MPGSDSRKRIPYSRKPEDLSLDEWQAELRKQFASEQKFKFKNIGDHPFYSDFEVFNPETGKTYKVSLRDNISSYNYCSCPDFKVNTLGTCKHVEYVLLKLLRYKKYQKYYSRPQVNNYSSLSILYGNKRVVRLKKADDSVRYTDQDKFFNSQGFLFPDMVCNLDDFIRSAVKADLAFRVYPDVFEYISLHKMNMDRNDRLLDIFPYGAGSKIFDNLVRTRLYPYQKEGIINVVKAGRVLLADDMGLGKTIQAIAAVEIFARYFNLNKVLVICPTSLKYQWKAEIRKFSGRNACIVEGLVHKRKDLYRQDNFYKIISYGIVRNDTNLINEWKADLVIMDEAQRIKNWKTQTAKAVKKIKSEYTIVTTGTPLENRIDELHSIVEYIDMYKLGPLFRFLDNHQVLDEHGKLIGYKNLRTINKTLEDILVRRTKNEIADQLPGRIDKNFFVEMTSEQMSDHNNYYEVVARLANKWIRQGYLGEEERQKLLICLNCMRMVADSTYILNTKTNSGNKIGELKSLIREVTEEKSNKLLIFSQWKKMFDLLTRELDNLGMDYVYLNGDIPARQRKEIIERFQNDHELKLFLSTDAGGVGVNLQSANILVNIDMPWNPAVLEQRIGRIYRLGQKKHIQVYNFIAERSIEHRILFLLDFKKNVFKGVLDDGGEDTVMIEGFLQSVKAMIDVDMEDPADKEPADYTFEKPFSQVAEANVMYHEDQHNNPDQYSKNQGQDGDSNLPGDTGERSEKGILSGFRYRLKKLAKRISNFLTGN